MSTKLPSTGRLVMVKWKDSAGSSNWNERGDTLGIAYNETVGWLTGKHRDRIVLSSSHSDSSTTWGQRTAIPRCDVTDVRKLRVGKRP